MDPDETFEELLIALRAGEFWEARDRADDLLGWLRRGGHAPKAFRSGTAPVLILDALSRAGIE